MDQTSGSVAKCSPIPGSEMILYFSVQLVEKLGGAEVPQSEKWEGVSPPPPPPPISPPLHMKQ